ncbi:variable surface protein [Plasmodium gonderi]|uniref:Variable surface protein n=1 Tax=Plasmodium gonderi TaxID=77519 RepID=A0A1Y1JPF7_PLAGO|nr:variable surface protein [Plasmodium gonderi]GAW84486.1 variable surface protein [Plasmodium gonderi]
MTEDALDITILSRIYPFLRKTWKLFEDLDETVETRLENVIYQNICTPVTVILRLHDKKYTDFCKKLIRNYNLLCNNPSECKINPSYCKDLNNWLYYYIKKENLDGEIFNNFFNYIISYSKMYAPENKMCLYSYDTNYIEPLKVLMLNIFESNISEIKVVLEGPHDIMKCYCQEFVKKMVQIYRSMNSEYCSNGNETKDKNMRICSVLRTFSSLYTIYLYNKESMKSILPSLTSENNIEFISCESSVEEKKLQLENEISTLTQIDTKNKHQEFEYHSSNITIINILPTFLSIIGGLSFFFMLSYKVHIMHFTPIGNIFRSKKRVKKVKSIYDGVEQKELLYHTQDNENINSYNHRYDIAYAKL